MSSAGKKRVVVFGAGSYGTALATVAARQGHDVIIVARNEDTCRSINEEHKNPKRMKEYTLASNISACPSIAEACAGADYIIHSIPAQNTFDFLSKCRDDIPHHIPIISTSKGIYTETLQLMSDVIPLALKRPAGQEQPLAYLSGPSFAKDLMDGSGPVAVVVASKNDQLAADVAEMMSSVLFRCYTSDDVVGVEVGGALKNPLAIVSGMLAGMGAGPSTTACMITRGCSEMSRLAVAMGGRPETLAGLSGVGDLILTASSQLSRNYRVGFKLAQGESLDTIVEEMGEVAEGVPTASVITQLLDKYDLDLPIFRTCKLVLAGEVTFQEAADLVMNRPLKKED